MRIFVENPYIPLCGAPQRRPPAFVQAAGPWDRFHKIPGRGRGFFLKISNPILQCAATCDKLTYGWHDKHFHMEGSNMDMHMQMQLPEPRYRGICKILLLVCAALMVVFFVSAFFPYYNFAEGDTLSVRGVEYTTDEAEEFSLMSFLGFPDNYEALSGFKKAGYKAEVFGYKVVNVMDVGPFLFLEVFALLMTILIILKKSMGKAFVCVIWGVVGTIGMFVNCLLRLGNTPIRSVFTVIVILELIVSVVCFVLYFMDSHRVSEYLREHSDVYK